MLKSKAKWNFIENQSMETSNQQLSISETLLIQRGITDKKAQDRFLNPQLEHIQSPEYLQGMDVACERIWKAIESGEQIIVYGDYDADGITATALLIKTLTELGAFCHYYIPHRIKEGYGLHETALKQMYDEGVTLIITVDNGISSIVEAEYATRLGIDLIITDHHELQQEIPESIAVIHPKLSPNYSFKELAGVGVAFQLAHQLLGEFPTHLLDLVAIGTIADLVPLQKDNRVFVYYGLQQLARRENIGLNLLIESCKIDNPITEEHIGFMIAPRLNAVGRLTNASLAVELLTTDDIERAKEIVVQINALNSERQQIVQQVIKEAEKKLENDDLEGVIMLYDPDWHEGVLGIAASRLVQKYDRPVFILTYKEETGELKGSARSIPAFNLFDNCYAMIELFTHFGGHSQAAGMTFPLENYEELKNRLNQRIFEQLNEDDFKQEIVINQSISLEQMNEDVINEINKFAPFGMGNERPVFHIEEIPNQINQIGQHKNHLKMQFRSNSKVVNAIGFQKGHLYALISSYVKVSLVGSLQLNEWNGNRTVQLMIDDIAVHDRQLFDYRGRNKEIDFIPFLENFSHHTIIDNSSKYENLCESNNMTLITYDQDVSTLENTDILYICYLPERIQSLANIVSATKPKCIYVCYGNKDHVYLQQLPTRQEFKWLYSYLLKTEQKEVKQEIVQIMSIKQWTKEKVIFMISVFLDLQFIFLQDRKIHVNLQAEKKDLKTSKTYQQKLQQSNMEKILYYSTYEELKNWFMKNIKSQDILREEVSHGI